MLVYPEFSNGRSAPKRIWRERIYPRLVGQRVAAVHQHRNPEPWLTLNCLTQFLAGHGFHRHELRFQGVVGGETTEREYRMLSQGRFDAPIVMLGGFPRSGTTSLQALVRAIYPSRIPECETVEQRFSLWEYPKHDVETVTQLAALPQSDVRVIVASRRFEDAVASLAVGRGSFEAVDLEAKVERWQAWMDLALSGHVVSVPFEAITALRPREMAGALSALTGLPVDREVEESDTYAELMKQSGKGDTSNPRQSNTPSSARSVELIEVRSQVIARVGTAKIAELAEIYEEVRSSGMSAFGTVDPA